MNYAPFRPSVRPSTRPSLRSSHSYIALDMPSSLNTFGQPGWDSATDVSLICLSRHRAQAPRSREEVEMRLVPGGESGSDFVPEMTRSNTSPFIYLLRRIIRPLGATATSTAVTRRTRSSSKIPSLSKWSLAK